MRGLEPLEDRYLPSVTINEFVIPTNNSQPTAIVSGPDGALWFTENNSNKIGRITTNGVFTEYALPAGTQPNDITVGSDGALWFADNSGYEIGRITTAGVITQYQVPGGGNAESITAGPDGALWFTDRGPNTIGRITTSGTITQYHIPVGGNPIDITTGPDGNLWFTQNGPNDIIRLTTSGVFTEYPIPGGGQPTGIVTGPDGALWFTESGTDGIGRITTTGAFTQYSLPAGEQPIDITVGADGNLWFTIQGNHSIGEITPAGVVTEYTIPTVNSHAEGITSGPDGAIWFVENNANKIGQAVFPVPLTANGASISATEGASFQGTVATFTDPDPYSTASDYTGTIAWGDGDSSPATISGNAQDGYTVAGSHVYAEEGSYTATVSITGLGGATAQVNDTATVADAPLTAAGTSISVTEGANFQGTVATFTDADPNGVPSDYTVTIAWGDGGTSAGTVSANAQGGFTVTGSHVYEEAGNYRATVSIADVGGATAQVTDTANVADAPLTGTGRNITIGILTPFSGVVASFTDANPYSQASDFTAVIDWGDGGTSSGTITANSQGGFDVSGSHTYLLGGGDTIQITVTDDDGGASVTIFSGANAGSLMVSPENIAATQDQNWSGVVADISNSLDPGAGAAQYTATILWGDGSSSAGTLTSDGNGGYNVLGTHSYADEGSYSATVHVQWSGGASANASDPVQVADAPLTAAGTNFTATEGANFEGTVATFTDADPNGVVSDYTATIAWGDGETSSGTISANAQGGFTVTGSHVYTEAGSYTATVSIADVGGATAQAADAATVADAPLTAAGTNFSATEGANFQGTVATFTDANQNGVVSDYTATIAWGDGETSAGTITANAQGGFTVNGSHVYAEEGTYTATVTIDDVGGATAQASDTATVADAPLTARGTTLNATQDVLFQGTVATFVDANPDSTASNFTALIAWGDGSTSAGVVSANPGGGFIVAGSHTYTQVGAFTAVVSIADVGGSTAQATTSAVVADAPLTATGTSLTLRAGQSYSGLVGTFMDADPTAVASEYSVTIHWGDGTTSSGTVTADPHGGFDVFGTKEYTIATTYSVALIIQDDQGASGNAISVVTVTPATSTGSPPAGGNSSSSGAGTGTSSRAPSSSGNGSAPVPSSPEPTTTVNLSGPALSLTLSLLASVPGNTGSTLASSTPADQLVPHVTALAGSGSGASAADSGAPSDKSQPNAVGAASANSAARGPAAINSVPPPAAPPSSGAPGTVSPPLARNGAASAAAQTSPHLESPQFTNALDRFQKDVDQSRQQPHWAIDAVFAGGVVTAGYVAITTRAVGWLMTALLSRPVWKAFDPIEILFAWEAQQKGGAPGRDDDGETLQSLVTTS